MKLPIKDALQVIVALLMTGSTAVAMAAPPTVTTPIALKQTAIVTPIIVSKPISKPSEPVQVPKPITWQDNPNHCTDAQWIAKDAPFSCIDKPVAAPAPQTAPSGPVDGCGDNEAAHFIYMHESGCRLTAMNPSGACGIGQALPCSKLANVCPDWQTNYACQNSFFSSYAIGRYGNWENASGFWQSHRWW